MLRLPPTLLGRLGRLVLALLLLATLGLWPASPPPAVHAETLDAEVAALQALYDSTGGPAWRVSPAWPATITAANACSLAGIGCDDQGHVTRIDLPFQNLNGTLPSELGNLTYLRRLDLTRTNLPTPTGIPATFANLTNLEFLDLTGTNVAGEIPASFGDLVALKTLRLSECALSGAIPDLSPLVALEFLDLSRNGLTGTISASLAGLPALRSLDLSHNQLSGSVPSAFGAAENPQPLLGYLGAYGNLLSGEIPASLGNLTGLAALDLGGNELTGEIPPALGDLAGLELLWLQQNQLTGEIPASLANLTALVLLELSSNDLTGEIPAALGNLAALKVCDLQENHLSGAIPATLAALTALDALHLAGNDLSGPIPATLGDMAALKTLDLAGNHLSGGIPPELGLLTQLETLGLGYNQLVGPVPAALGNATALTSTDLRYNMLWRAGPYSAHLEALLAPYWHSQTVPPTGVAATAAPGGAEVTWEEAPGYTADGHFEVGLAGAPEGPYQVVATTADREAMGIRVTGLAPGQPVYLAVRSVSDAFEGQKNVLQSPYSAAVEVTPLGMTIVGPTEGSYGEPYTFTAQVTPLLPTEPITYTWAPEPTSGQGTATATYSFERLTVQHVAVVVQAAGHVLTDTHPFLPLWGATVPVSPSQAVTMTLDASGGGTVGVAVPAGAAEEPFTLLYGLPTQWYEPPEGLYPARHHFTLQAYRNGALVPGLALSAPITLTLTYLDVTAPRAVVPAFPGVGFREDTLTLYERAGDAWVDAAAGCEPASATLREPAENRLTVPICRLGEFGLFGELEWTLYLPVISPAPGVR
jgi:Leucine-rich repeat (LRR) protein